MEMVEVYHAGEREVQSKAGARMMADQVGRMVTAKLVPAAMAFMAQQDRAYVAVQDAEGHVWTTLLMGERGFAVAPDSGSVEVALEVDSLKGTRLESEGSVAQVGLLFIELGTRRRIRVNGPAQRLGKKLYLQVGETFFNCPKYIQRRVEKAEPRVVGDATGEGTYLNGHVEGLIRRSDTFFVGSISQQGRLDVSHRGGPQGFVEVLPGSVLKVPDYQGNNMFTTLGNFVDNPKAGMLFVDFETGELVELTGRVEVAYGMKEPEELDRSTGTGRYWYFTVERWRIMPAEPRMQMDFIDPSPFNPA